MRTSIGRGSSTGPSSMISKVQTGIVGMDDVLNGGIPEGWLTLIGGGPGTGKTILGLEFLVRGAEEGHPGILLSFEEREKDLQSYGAGFGWNLTELEARERLGLISARIQSDAILSGDFDLRGILSILYHKADAIQAKRIVIDAPDAFLRVMNNAARERAELHVLHEWLREMGMTALMTVKRGTGTPFSSHYEFLEYLADCVIYLDHRVLEQVTTRRLRVVKYRGSAFGRNEYPFAITDQGVWVAPVTQISLQHQALGPSMPSGVKGLDEILAGGYRRGSCTLITGTSGTGKTTFACSFAVASIARGERLLYLDFEESWKALVSCMTSPGIDMQAAHDSCRLRFISTMPESQGVEEHLIMSFRAIDDFNPNHLVIDAISACRRMGSSHSAFDYLLRIISRCKQKGISSLLTNLTASDANNEITGMDLSSVIDTVIILRNVERQGAFRRELAVVKSRGRGHSNRIHPFEITDHGVRIGREEEAHVQ